MNFESIIQMAKGKNQPEKVEKTQEELRAVLAEKLKSFESVLNDGLKEYEETLTKGVFKDRDDEAEGSGEARKEAMQKKLTELFDRAEKMKAKIESKEILPTMQEEIQVNYSYTNPKTGKVETQETITINFEEKLASAINFYGKMKIDLPADFEDIVRDMWDRNQGEIEQAIEEKGFDEMLIVPGNIPLTEIKDKLTMESGYYESDNFEEGGSFAGAVSQNVDKPRIILYHKKSLPEIQRMNGLEVHLNITAGNALKLYQQNPNQYLSTLEDMIILERKNLEETGTHISDFNNKSACWLPGTKSGARLVDSGWDPGHHGLIVSAVDPGDRDGIVGLRPSRCFF